MTTTRRSLPRAVRTALALWIAVSTVGVAPAHAASGVQIDARVLVGGRYEVGGWAAISVTLVNEGSPTEGHLTAESDAGTMRRFVEMPAGARKVVTLYVRPGGFQQKMSVRYVEPNGTVEATAELRVLDVSARQVAIVGDPEGTLRPQFAGPAGSAAADPISLATSDLPERPEPLGGLDVIVWAADGGAISDAQRRSIERWVGDGGQLVLIAGADWQARSSGFEHLLPMEELAAIDGVDHAPLAAWAGADEPLEPGTVASGSLRDGARALVVADDGAPMAAWHAVGAGRVIMFGSDLSLDAYRAWRGSPLLWSRVIGGQGALAEWFGGGFPGGEDTSAAMARALQTLPALDVPPAELLLAVIVAYILLIGPVSYLVLRRLDRRELAWVTAPVLIVLFSACSYGIGITLKGTDVIVNQIAVVRSASGASQASVESYAGVYSPVRGTYDVLVEGDALVGRMQGDRFGGGTSAPSLVADQGVPARLTGLSIAARWFEYVRADMVVEHEPLLSVEWSSRGDDLVGTVTNVGSESLTDVAYISRAGGRMVGDLEPGERGEFVIDLDGFTQSGASDQVYGFGGFSGPDSDRRRIAARRSVIDGLVGYGGRIPVGSELTNSGGIGPYVIGWRPGEGPSAITLDGVETLRFAEIVEVVAIHPGIGSGDVVVGPDQMGIGVTTEGGASQIGVGTATLGREPGATATFDITLPLEASDIVVSSLEIITGIDPSVIQDPGGFRGFWPDGWSIEVQDPRSGDWTTVGELGDETRLTIKEPASAISSAGRISVRVTGGGADPNFGDPSVFVSARVTGVIEP